MSSDEEYDGGGGRSASRSGRKSARQKYSHTIDLICEQHGVNPDAARLMVCEGRKVVYVLNYGAIQSTACVFRNQKPTPSYRSSGSLMEGGPVSQGGDSGAGSSSMMMESAWDTVVIPVGWKVAVIVNDEPWIGETKYEESALNGHLMLTYGFQQLDENGDIAGVMEWRDTPGAAFKAAYERSVSYQKSGRHNGKLYMGVHYEHPQRILRERCRADLRAGRYDKDPELKRRLVEWVDFKPPGGRDVSMSITSSTSTASASSSTIPPPPRRAVSRQASKSSASVASNNRKKKASVNNSSVGSKRSRGKGTRRRASSEEDEGEDDDDEPAPLEEDDADVSSLVSTSLASATDIGGETKVPTLDDEIRKRFAMGTSDGMAPAQPDITATVRALTRSSMEDLFTAEEIWALLLTIDQSLVFADPSSDDDDGESSAIARGVEMLQRERNSIRLRDILRILKYIPAVRTIDGLSFEEINNKGNNALKLMMSYFALKDVIELLETVRDSLFVRSSDLAASDSKSEEDKDVSGLPIEHRAALFIAESIVAFDLKAVLGSLVGEESNQMLWRLVTRIPDVESLKAYWAPSAPVTVQTNWKDFKGVEVIAVDSVLGIRVVDELRLAAAIPTRFTALSELSPEEGSPSQFWRLFVVENEQDSDRMVPIAKRAGCALFLVARRGLVAPESSRDVLVMTSNASTVLSEDTISAVARKVLERGADGYRRIESFKALSEVPFFVGTRLGVTHSILQALTNGPRKRTAASGPTRGVMVCGAMGSGKTALVAAIVRRQIDLRGFTTVAVHAFSHAEPRRDSVLDCFRSLARQLRASFSIANDEEEEEVAVDEKMDEEPRFKASFDRLIVNLLRQSEGLLPKTLIIIDGVDQCEAPGVLIRVLSKAILPPHIKLIVTSRPRITVMEELPKASGVFAVVSLDDRDEKEQDVARALSSLAMPKDDRERSLLGAIARQANGNFRWAKIAWISSQRVNRVDGKSKSAMAHDLLSDTQLDGLYELEFERLAKTNGIQLDEILIRLLLIARESPVPIELLLGPTVNHEKDILETLSTVFVVDMESRTISSPHHPSMSRFFRNQLSRRSTTTPHIDSDPSLHLKFALRLQEETMGLIYEEDSTVNGGGMARYAARNALFHWTMSEALSPFTQMWVIDLRLVSECVRHACNSLEDMRRFQDDVVAYLNRFLLMMEDAAQRACRDLIALLDFAARVLVREGPARFLDLALIHGSASFKAKAQRLLAVDRSKQESLKPTTIDQAQVHSVSTSLFEISGTFLDVLKDGLPVCAAPTGRPIALASPQASLHPLIVNEKVECVAFTETDPALLAEGMNDGSVRLRDVFKNHTLWTNTSRGPKVTAVAMNTKLVLAGYADGTYRAWLLEGGLELSPSNSSSSSSTPAVRSIVQISKDSAEDNAFAVAYADGLCRVVRLAGPSFQVEKELRFTSAPTASLTCLAYCSSTQTIIAGFEHDATVRAMGLEGDSTVAVASTIVHRIQCIEVVNSAVFVSGFEASEVHMYRISTESGLELKWIGHIECPAPWDRVTKLRTASADHLYVLSASTTKKNEMRLDLVEINHGEALGDSGNVQSLAQYERANSAGGAVFITFTNGSFRKASIGEGRESLSRTRRGNLQKVDAIEVLTAEELNLELPKSDRSDLKGNSCLAASGVSEQLMGGFNNGEVIVWGPDRRNAKTMKLIATLKPFTNRIVHCGFSAQSTLAFCSAHDEGVAVIDTRTWAIKWRIPAASPTAFAFDDRSGSCIYYAIGSTIHVTTLNDDGTVNESRTLGEPDGSQILSISIAASASRLMCSSLDQMVREWDLSTGQCSQVIQVSMPIETLSFAGPDRVIAYSRMGIKLWDVNDSSWTVLNDLAGPGSVCSAGKSFASICDRSRDSVAIWNTKQAKQERIVRLHDLTRVAPAAVRTPLKQATVPPPMFPFLAPLAPSFSNIPPTPTVLPASSQTAPLTTTPTSSSLFPAWSPMTLTRSTSTPVPRPASSATALSRQTSQSSQSSVMSSSRLGTTAPFAGGYFPTPTPTPPMPPSSAASSVFEDKQSEMDAAESLMRLVTRSSSK